MAVALYQVVFTLDQLCELRVLLELSSARERDPEAIVFVLLDVVHKARVEAIKDQQFRHNLQ